MELHSASLGIGARVKHPSFGEGIVVDMDNATLQIFFKGEGDREISRNFEGLKVIESPKDGTAIPDTKLIEESLRKVLKDMIEPNITVELAKKWEGGTLELHPANRELQSKEVPIETFWHKIVMLRDRLRVLEQNINSHEKLNDGEKIHLQQYISRIYGTLTTFNVLFADKEDQFSSKG
jgi:hypothetical protein